MGASNSLVATLLAMAGQRNVITIPRAFVRFTGDLESAMLLNQLLYWMPRSHLDGDSIYKTDSDWQEELCLTRYAVRKARETLIGMGFLTTSVHHQKGTPAVHYHIDYELLIEKWEAWLQSNGVKSENELYPPPSKVRKRTLPDESNSNPDTVKSESRQTMNHRVPTENTIHGGGGDRARDDFDLLVALFARYDITQAEPLARLYREQWPDVTIDQLARLCEQLSEPEAGGYAGARLYRKLKAGPYERRSPQPDHAPDRPRRSAVATRGKHAPTGGSEIRDPGWVARELARLERGDV